MEDFFAPTDIDTGFKPKTGTAYAIYKPKPEEGDPTKGYKSVLRLLPNMLADGSRGVNSFEKTTHFVKTGNSGLDIPIDSMRYFGQKCPLNNAYWTLKKSTDIVEQERAKNMINAQTNYFAYAQVVEDKQKPELEGKVVILRFPNKIWKKIEEERNGEITGVRCNVFDPINGKDLVLIVKKVGGYPNYESSSFRPLASKMLIDGAPVATVAAADGQEVIAPAARARVKECLLARPAQLEDFMPKPWDEATKEKVNQIVDIVLNNAPIRNSTGNGVAPDSDYELDVMSAVSASATASSAGTQQGAAKKSSPFEDDSEIDLFSID